MTEEITEIKGYNLKLFQHKKGYRFSIDSFLLAWFVSQEKFKNGFEIGAGSGIVSLLVERMTFDSKNFELVEIQHSLFSLLKKNLKINAPYKSKFVARNEDARFVLPSEKPDIVYSNPPFTDYSKGKVSPYFEKAAARHGYFLTPDSMFHWFMENTPEDCVLAVVETAKNEDVYRKLAEKYGFFIKETVYVSPFPGSKPNLILFSLSKKPCEFKKDFLFVYQTKGVYSDKVKQILGIL